MKKNRILFITQDLAVGGGTSSLSSLYTEIRNDFEISVLVLTSVGEARVSYNDVIIHPCRLTDLFYRTNGKDTGIIKYVSYFVKAVFRTFGMLGINVNKINVWLNRSILMDYHSVISFGEGCATQFTQYINIHPRSAWIHFEVSKYPFSKSFQHLYQQFDHIITVSNAIAERLKITYPLLSSKIQGIHNIIDKSRIEVLAKETIPEVFSEKEFNIISLGRVSKVKRFPRIPVIAKYLVDKGYLIKWRVYGPENDEDELKQFNDNVMKYHLNSIVEYCGNKTNPYPYLAQSDLMVILSESEACPMIITEARILNIPVVSSDFATASEFIENGTDGIICPIEKVATAIEDYMINRSLKNKFIEKSKERILNNEFVIQQFKKIVIS